MKMNFVGKMSTFGGPKDTGVAPGEGLALVNSAGDFEKLQDYFLEGQPAGTTGAALKSRHQLHRLSLGGCANAPKLPRQYAGDRYQSEERQKRTGQAR